VPPQPESRDSKLLTALLLKYFLKSKDIQLFVTAPFQEKLAKLDVISQLDLQLLKDQIEKPEIFKELLQSYYLVIFKRLAVEDYSWLILNKFKNMNVIMDFLTLEESNEIVNWMIAITPLPTITMAVIIYVFSKWKVPGDNQVFSKFVVRVVKTMAWVTNAQLRNGLKTFLQKVKPMKALVFEQIDEASRLQLQECLK